MKKTGSFFLTLCLIVSLIPAPTANAAIKINKAKATLEVDAMLTLKITGTNKKVTWSTNKQNIAIVDNNGTVTAKKEGQATITATVNGEKYTCEVKVVNSICHLQ